MECVGVVLWWVWLGGVGGGMGGDGGCGDAGAVDGQAVAPGVVHEGLWAVETHGLCGKECTVEGCGVVAFEVSAG